MCRVLKVSVSGYYAWRKRPHSRQAAQDRALSARIVAIYRHSDGTYGCPRIYQQLRAEGVQVGHNRVARLMRVAGLRGVSRRRRFVTTTQRASMAARPAPDLVRRDFRAEAPNRLWVADVSHIPTWEGFLYLAVVLDVFSRRIVGWAMAGHLRTELVLAALEMAFAQRRPEAVIHHSDQGAQYTSIAFGHRCKALGVRPSMGRSETVSTTPWPRASLPAYRPNS